MLLIALLGILSLVLVRQVLKAPKIHRNGQRLKRPSDTLPIFGNAIRFLQPRYLLFDWFTRQQTELEGETYEISVPTLPPGVVINTPENIEFVLKNESLISKGDFFRKRSWDLFGYGIINATGDLWRAQRKAGLRFFGGDNLDALIEDVLPDAYEKKKAQLSKLAETGEEFDLQRVFLDLTTSVVGQMAYDMDFDASSPFSRAFDYASDHIALRFQNPFYRVTELFIGSRFRASVDEVKKFGAKIVSNARRRRGREAFESLIDNTEPQFGSLIDSLLESFASPQIVADAAMNFLSAGRDTTAQSMTWTFYALLRHPHCISRLRDEIAQLPDVDKLTVADLQPTSIPYTTAVFYESLRHYPPVPIEIKQCLVPVTLPDGTFLPQDAIIVWCIHSLNRSCAIHGRDAASFLPQNWLSSSDEGGVRRFVPRSAFEFPVFNGGPRACLGKKMAELMATWVMVRFLYDWDFDEVSGPGEGKVERGSQNSLTLPMERGLPVRVRKRQRP